MTSFSNPISGAATVVALLAAAFAPTGSPAAEPASEVLVIYNSRLPESKQVADAPQASLSP
jgi:hypothetical protein